ncbi:MAG: DUF2442 domain-containing protein [Lachnospiraceae bacterium]|nr:DUF2442 domain-containing protein [Lachnospiraceae bacterium]
MFHKVKCVQPLSSFKLAVDFVNGEKRVYDVTPLFDKWESFTSLKEIDGLFRQVKVDSGGYGISWNDEIDLACDELYHNGVYADS